MGRFILMKPTSKFLFPS